MVFFDPDGLVHFGVMVTPNLEKVVVEALENACMLCQDLVRVLVISGIELSWGVGINFEAELYLGAWMRSQVSRRDGSDSIFIYAFCQF